MAARRLALAVCHLAFCHPAAGGGADIEILAPHDGLSISAGARRAPVCGGGSTALVVVRNSPLRAAGAQVCVALSEPEGGGGGGAPLRLRVNGADVASGAEVCLPPGQGKDISPALPASTSLAVPFSAAAAEGGGARTRTLRLRAVLRRAGVTGDLLAEVSVELTVLPLGADAAAGCVGPLRFDDAAEVAGMYRLLAAARAGGVSAIAAAATAITDAVPQSGRLATAAAFSVLRATQPRFLAPQWCAMLRHPGCIESEYAPASMPGSPYATTAELVQGWNRQVLRLTTAISRGRLALTHDGGHWSSMPSADELAGLDTDVTRAQNALVDAQLVSSVLAHSVLAPLPPPLLAIVFMTMRPGGYDVLLSSLAAQTDTRYELFCVDELTAGRRSTVSKRAAALGVNLIGLQPGKPRPRPPPSRDEDPPGAAQGWRFGYANAMNTGLIGIATKHSASGTPPPTAVTILQDFIWLPPDFVENTLSFYNGGGGQQRPSLLSYPRKLFSAPASTLNMDTIGTVDGAAPLSIFKEPLTASPEAMSWPLAPPAWDTMLAEGAGTAAAQGVSVAAPSFYWECFACTAPWTAVLALNGVDERLDETGDDCHERNLSERARLLGYDVRLLQGTPVMDIDHRGFTAAAKKKQEEDISIAAVLEKSQQEEHDPLWQRSESNTNVEHWGKSLSEIVDLVAPIRSGAPGIGPNPFELWRGDSIVFEGHGEGGWEEIDTQSSAGGNSGDGRALIALIMPVTSMVKDCLTCKSYASTNIKKLLLFTVLMESFLKSVDWDTEGREFRFAFYCAYDPGDAVYDDPIFRSAIEKKAEEMLAKHAAKLVLERVVRDAKQLEWGNIMPLWNAVADRAQSDGAEYLYLVNDDLELTSAGWASTLTGMLRANPLRPNFGVAAGVGYEGEDARNATHGNFPMIHRTHLEIFGGLYPETFSNWYADPWVCDIYQPFESFFHAAHAGISLPPSLESILVIDRQPFRYIRNNIIPDGWFDYPDATNKARRTLQTWLGKHVDADAAVVVCPEGRAFCRPAPVATLDVRWCLSPRDGRFFGDRGENKLSCDHDLWHRQLECWVPGRDSEVDFTGKRRQDTTAQHLGAICAADALQAAAAKEEKARAAAATVRCHVLSPPTTAAIRLLREASLAHSSLPCLR